MKRNKVEKLFNKKIAEVFKGVDDRLYEIEQKLKMSEMENIQVNGVEEVIAQPKVGKKQARTISESEKSEIIRQHADKIQEYLKNK